jgi:hypothetical protein
MFSLQKTNKQYPQYLEHLSSDSKPEIVSAFANYLPKEWQRSYKTALNSFSTADILP